MVRTISVKNRDYIVVVTTLETTGVESPVQIHIDVTNLDRNSRWVVQKHAIHLFDHKLKAIPPSKPQGKKSWYKFW